MQKKKKKEIEAYISDRRMVLKPLSMSYVTSLGRDSQDRDSTCK